VTHPAAPAIPGFTESSYLGSGGFADVFQYRHRTGAAYAVKVWRREFADDAWAQLQVEARALGRLASFGNHPNIIAPQPPSLVNGRPYLIMEFCPDGSLAGKGPMRVADVVRIGIQMCGALETAHLHDVLHCDVKPANILLSRDGTAKLSDFGIAEPVSSNAESGAMLTPQYSAPEVDADGQTSPLSDVYALAASLYELITGAPPFRLPGGDNGREAIEDRKRRDAVPKMQRGDVPPELERLLRFALRASIDARAAVLGGSGDSGPAAVFGTELRRIAAISRDEPTAMVVYRPTGPVDAPVAGGLQPLDDPDYAAPSFVPAKTPVHPGPTLDGDLMTQRVAAPSLPQLPSDYGQTVDRTIRREQPNATPQRSSAARIALVAGSAVLIAAAVTGIVLGTRSGTPVTPVSTPSATLPIDDPNLQAFVPTPKVTVHRVSGGDAQFTWTYQPVDPGDTFVVTRTDTATSTHQSVDSPEFIVDASTGDHPCIEVIVVRANGRSSANAGRACAGG
jgi:serine/threonine protein kinase